MEITPEYKIELARELRQRQTESEARLWQLLRNSGLNGLKFRRQHPIGRYIADFCCEEARLVVEIDGGYHEETDQKENDAERAAYIVGSGYRIVRLSVNDVMSDMRSALKQIQAAVQRDV